MRKDLNAKECHTSAILLHSLFVYIQIKKEELIDLEDITNISLLPKECNEKLREAFDSDIQP